MWLSVPLLSALSACPPVRHPTRPGLLRKQQTLLASLVGAVAARLMMAAFLVYQKWRYDSRHPS
jgi:hypothetical protein